MNDINDWYLNGSLPKITSVDRVFNSQKDRMTNLKNRPRSSLANQYVSLRPDTDKNKIFNIKLHFKIKDSKTPLKKNTIKTSSNNNQISNITKQFNNLCIFNQYLIIKSNLSKNF